MSIHTFHGGKFRPQSGGRLIYRPQSGGTLISRASTPPTPFLPGTQVGYGLGGVLKPLARTVYTAAKGQLKKIPKYLGKLAKRHGKKAAKQVFTAAISGQFKKGQRKKTVKRLVASNLQKVKKDIRKDIQKAVAKSIRQPTRKMPTKKKPSHKRKGFSLKYRTKPAKRRRKDIFDK